MIKNGHHHNHHQVNTAAGKDAGTTPGATACSPEKRRRRIRVWCDGWWVLKCVMKIPRHCGYAHCLHRARFIGCGSVIPAAGQACCRLQDAHSAAASFFTGISMHTTSWVRMLLKVYTLLSSITSSCPVLVLFSVRTLLEHQYRCDLCSCLCS